MRWIRLAASAVLVFACIVGHMAHAQDYPSHAIRLVLPQPPSGAIDC
jgi:tripartite-type tricarboxylate transporter receptor subunit TctC